MTIKGKNTVPEALANTVPAASVEGYRARSGNRMQRCKEPSVSIGVS